MAGARPPDRAPRRREHRVDRGPAVARHRAGAARQALPPEDRKKISEILSRYENEGIRFHALRTRASGQRRFISMHVLVPGKWTVQMGHDLSERIERDLAAALPQSAFFIHIEPSEDPASFADQSLDRGPSDKLD